MPLPGATGASARTRYTLLAEATGDLDGDGHTDRATVVAVDSGGSGTFLHVAAVLLGVDPPRPLESALLGDRVALEGLRIEPPGHVVVRFRAHAPGQPLAEPPRIEKTATFRVHSDRLVEVYPSSRPPLR